MKFYSLITLILVISATIYQLTLSACSMTSYCATNMTTEQQQLRKVAVARTREILKNQNAYAHDVFDIYVTLINRLAHMQRHDMFEITMRLEHLITTLEAEEPSTDMIFLKVTATNLKKLIRVGKGKSRSRSILWQLTHDVMEQVYERKQVAALEHNAALNNIPKRQLATARFWYH